jgi:arsenite-transporting ATPase
MGLGMVADQLKELKLGELLETPPPGLDEAVAIAKVVQFVNSQVRRDAERLVALAAAAVEGDGRCV